MMQQHTQAVRQPAPIPEPVLTFDQWFGLENRAAGSLRLPHHRAGMRAWTSTAGKRTRTAWDTLFARY